MGLPDNSSAESLSRSEMETTDNWRENWDGSLE